VTTSLPVAPAAAPAFDRTRYARLAGRVKLLSWLSLAWMTLEGAVALFAGFLAGSIALIGFGLDSVIEGLASVIIIWRFTGQRVFSQRAEDRRRNWLPSSSSCWPRTSPSSRSRRSSPPSIPT
jgi:hypothetical protein